MPTRVIKPDRNKLIEGLLDQAEDMIYKKADDLEALVQPLYTTASRGFDQNNTVDKITEREQGRKLPPPEFNIQQLDFKRSRKGVKLTVKTRMVASGSNTNHMVWNLLDRGGVQGADSPPIRRRIDLRTRNGGLQPSAFGGYTDDYYILKSGHRFAANNWSGIILERSINAWDHSIFELTGKVVG